MATSAKKKLSHYHAKRDFARTPEPSGETAPEPGRRLVIQQHFARRLHYDLRLEIDGVLVSWAVTRGPSANPKDKRLAVRTEDHPLSYGSFEGVIPKPQYGGGTVILWESCEYRTLNGPATKGLEEGHINFEAMGERMQGAWALVRMKFEGKAENWLLVKDRDAYAEADDSLASSYKTGVVSGRTAQEIEQGKSPAPAKSTAAKSAKADPPAFVAPQLCAIAEDVPEGEDWAFEMKYDGYRLLVAAASETVRIYTRSGLDWTAKFPEIAAAARALHLPPTLLDGEAVVFNAKGISDFPALVNALQRQRTANVVYVAFDLLADKDIDTRKLAYLERKEKLQSLLPAASHALRYGDHVLDDGQKLFTSITTAGGEGIIAKRKSAPYVSGRSGNWIKVKGELRQDVTIIGFMPSTKHGSFASLLAAQSGPEGQVFVGRIGTGYNARNRPDLSKRLAPEARKAPPLANAQLLPHGAKFITKPFSAEIQFGGWTADRQLRQARFLGVQDDREPPMAKTVKAAAIAPKGTSTWRITHPDRILFPQDKITKGVVAAYYENIKALILPHLEGRPVSLLRAPESIAAETFFQRHPLKGMTSGIKTFGSNKSESYFALEGEAGLAAAVQFGAIEFHGWNATLPKLDRPDRMIFDLDPDEALPFAKVKSAAALLREFLQAAGLESWPLLSGGKGIHVVVPLDRSNTSAEVENFCKQFAKRLEIDKPEIFVANMSIAKRKGRIFVDYLRNRTKATAIIPWSLRARPGAAIAAPVSWESLPAIKSAADFTIGRLPPEEAWSGFRATRQHLSKHVLALLQQ